MVVTLSSFLLQYERFLHLMERLLSMPYCATEEEFVLRYRRQLESQSKKQTVPPLERDEKGVAFSTAEGRPIGIKPVAHLFIGNQSIY